MQTVCSCLDEEAPENTGTEVDREGRVTTVPHAWQTAPLDFEPISIVRPHLGQYSVVTLMSVRKRRRWHSPVEDSSVESCSSLTVLQLLPALLALIHVVDKRPAFMFLEIQF